MLAPFHAEAQFQATVQPPPHHHPPPHQVFTGGVVHQELSVVVVHQVVSAGVSIGVGLTILLVVGLTVMILFAIPILPATSVLVYSKV